MKRAYPTFIVQDDKDYLVFVPDMAIYTEGESFADAIGMARDAIGLAGISMEDKAEDIPEASPMEAARSRAREERDLIDFSEGILTYVDVDFTEYRRQVDNRSVRRNVTLPNWLNIAAENANLNVSRVLQDALMAQLGANKQ